MKKVELPRGIKHRIESLHTGIIIPGTDNEPLVTLFGRGSTIQYRLISCAMKRDCIIEETYSTGSLEDEEIEAIDSWVDLFLPSLLQEAGVRHFIRFLPNSKCYYDFGTQTLYGADGYKEKKGSRDGNKENTAKINGEPFKPKDSEISFVELLTRTPRAEYPQYDVEDVSGLKAKSLTQTWSLFKQHDSSIDATFDRKNGKFFYQGSPQVWVIGEEEHNERLTLNDVFRTAGCWDVIVASDKKSGHQFCACLGDDVVPETALRFLGMNKALLNLSGEVNVERFVNENCCPASILKELLGKYCISLEAVWKALRDNVSENLMLSLSASTYHYETDTVPLRLADLKGYTITNERMEKSLQRICPTIKELITSSRVGTDFFAYCDTDVKPASLVDYVVALILSCLSYCQSEGNDNMTTQVKIHYRSLLTALIHKKFHFNPPRDGKESILEEIHRLVIEVQSEIKDAGLDSAASKVTKINDLVNLLGYNDNNCLMSPSMGREL